MASQPTRNPTQNKAHMTLSPELPTSITENYSTQLQPNTSQRPEQSPVKTNDKNSSSVTTNKEGASASDTHKPPTFTEFQPMGPSDWKPMQGDRKPGKEDPMFKHGYVSGK